MIELHPAQETKLQFTNYSPAMSFNTRSNKPVLWIDREGKIHVDETMAANDVARQVINLLQGALVRNVCPHCHK